MKKLITLLLSLTLILCVFSFAGCKDDSTKTAKDTFTVKLKANATTGYSWRATPSDKNAVSIEDDYKVDSAPEGMVGVGGTQIYNIKGKKSGDVTVTFTYEAPGTKEIALVAVYELSIDKSLKITEKSHRGTYFEQEDASKKEDDDTLKILTIGNSFSDDTMQYVYDILQDIGINKVYLGNLYIGGCSLDTHYKNSVADSAAYDYRTNGSGEWSTAPRTKMSYALGSKDWDIISFQQKSGDSGRPETYTRLDDLIKYVKSYCPDATLVWNMTWAYQGDSDNAAFVKYGKNQTVMYTSIVSAVNKKILTDKNIKTVSPTGTAIQNARTSFVGDNLTRDGYHLSKDFGRLVAGLTFVKALTDKSIDNVTFKPEGVDDAKLKIAIESANNAISNPYSVTQSAYTAHP